MAHCTGYNFQIMMISVAGDSFYRRVAHSADKMNATFAAGQFVFGVWSVFGSILKLHNIEIISL